MTQRPFNNDSTPAEREAVIKNDQRIAQERSASSYHQFAQAEADIDRGRFTAHEKSAVVGSTPMPAYPQGPTWCAGDQGLEPVLGVDINALEPCGQPHEIAASLTALGEGSAPMSAQSLLADVVTEETPSPSSTENIEDDDDLPPAA